MSAAAFKPTKEQVRAAHGKKVPDVIASGLKVLFAASIRHKSRHRRH